MAALHTPGELQAARNQSRKILDNAHERESIDLTPLELTHKGKVDPKLKILVFLKNLHALMLFLAGKTDFDENLAKKIWKFHKKGYIPISLYRWAGDQPNARIRHITGASESEVVERLKEIIAETDLVSGLDFCSTEYGDSVILIRNLFGEVTPVNRNQLAGHSRDLSRGISKLTVPSSISLASFAEIVNFLCRFPTKVNQELLSLIGVQLSAHKWFTPFFLTSWDQCH